MNIRCDNCGKEIKRKVSTVADNRLNFCSIKCHTERMKGKANPFAGKHHSDLSRAKMSHAKKSKSYEEICGKEKAVKLKQFHSRRWVGELNPNFNRHFSMETRQKLRKASLGKTHSSETKLKMSKSHRGLAVGDKNPMFNKRGLNAPGWRGGKIKRVCLVCGKEFRVDPNVIKRGFGKFCSKSCSRKSIKFPKHHTKPEMRFEEICQKHNLPFKYTGDGALWIENINPDFVESNGRKIAIDIFGDYWHNPLLNKNIKKVNTYEYRKIVLEKYGWRLVIFWQSQLVKEDAEATVLSQLSTVGGT